MIKLNVGGKLFCTTKTTLTALGENFFTKMIENHESKRIPSIVDENGAYFVDRNGEIFGDILEYLRTNELDVGAMEISKQKKIQKELDFYGIPLPKISEINEIKGKRRIGVLQRDLYNPVMFFGFLPHETKDFGTTINNGISGCLPALQHLVNQGWEITHWKFFDSPNFFICILSKFE